MSLVKSLIRQNRTYRRFDNTKKIEINCLVELVDSARISQSAANLQPLRYVLVSDPGKCSEVFETLTWAGYLTDWEGPTTEEQPTGYIVIMAEKENSFTHVDAGLAMQNICLTAIESGIGSCIFASIKREKLANVLKINDSFNILYVIALGYPVENVQLVSIKDTPDHKYYRDENKTHFVPKRTIDEVVIDKF